MTFEFLSPEARRAVVSAQKLARARDQPEVELEHLLLALLDLPEVAAVLHAAGADLEALRAAVDRALGELPKVLGESVYLGGNVLRLFDIAQIDARERGGERVEPQHLLLGIPLETRAPAAVALRRAGATLPKLEEVIKMGTLGGSPIPPATDSAWQSQAASTRLGAEAPRAPTPLLDRFARDLTALAAAGALDPVIARDDEIRRLMQILGRRGKNSPIVVGEPGVGKTALVEGLAQRMAAGDVPAGLRGKRLLSLDLGALVAGAKLRGEFEDRVRGVLQEIRAAQGEILLFIDEIHALVGAGRAEGSLDAASLFKPALARGELSAVGATTLDEYRTHIEKDPAFERRFQPVLVSEPGDEACVAMLRAIKRRYEQRHGIGIQDAAVTAAVTLARRYVAGRSLPDKAIDLLDEAGSRLRLELDSRPDEVDVLERRATALRVELEAVGRERSGDGETAARRGSLSVQIQSLTARLGPLREKWQAELGAIGALHAARTTLGEAERAAEAAERRGDLGAAAEQRYGKLPGLEQAVTAAEARLREVQGEERLLEDAVEPMHVARVVADWTGIPVARMLEGERKKLLGIEARLAARVVGQPDAVGRVARAVKRARAGLQDPGRPIGSLIFLGPTGVGKTELAKALAEFLFDDEAAMVRLDMSEYMEKHAVARLTGAPPGYVGYDEGGQLTEAVRRRPYTVVLLDEVEKAHPDVFNVLLQVLDDGRLTDSRGRTVSFANVVLIMTSNLAAAAIAASVSDRAAMRREVDAALRGHFRPEFLNRIDEVVVFDPLGPKEIEAIVDLQVKRLGKLLAEQRITLALAPEALARVAAEGYDPAFGARPVKRAIQRLLRDPLAEKILAGEVAAGDTVRVGPGDAGGLAFDK